MLNSLNVDGLNTLGGDELRLISPGDGSKHLVNGDIVFYASGAEDDTYTWTIGSETVAGNNFTRKFATEGSIIVSLTATVDGEVKTIEHIISIGRAPSITNIRPAGGEVDPNTEISFTAEAAGTEPITITWDFSDGTTAEGARVTHEFQMGTASPAVVTVTAASGYGTASRSIELHIKYPRWVWEDAWGQQTNLSDISRYIVLRDGINGFSGVTFERALKLAASEEAEYNAHQIARARNCGFNILMIGKNHADLDEARENLLRIFSRPGRLIITLDSGQKRTLAAYAARGYPNIRGGLPPGIQAKTQTVEVQFEAPDPYFYGEVQRVYAVDGIVELDNPGTARQTPCRMKLAGATCTNQTSGKSMTGVAGAEVTITDRGVTAALDGANCIGQFSVDSEFWMLEHGENRISGAEWVEYTPRWTGA